MDYRSASALLSEGFILYNDFRGESVLFRMFAVIKGENGVLEVPPEIRVCDGVNFTEDIPTLNDFSAKWSIF